ncbi:MAG: cation diffusion facilitator family transporter [Acidithiobacillus ferrivorans]
MSKSEHKHASAIESTAPRKGIAGGLIWGIALNLSIVVVEVIVGLIANSLGLLSDAAHNFTDITALGITWYGMAQAKKPPNAEKTFGYHRTGILTALINAITIVLVTAWIFYEAYQRFLNPQPVAGRLVLVTAAIALFANLSIVGILKKAHSGDINIRGAILHLIGDAAASAAVLVAGLVIIATGWYPVDPLISIIIGLALLWGAWGIIRETLEIFLEEAPRAIEVNKLVAEMKEEKGVRDIHDIHVWTIGSGLYALSCHVLVEDVMVSEGGHILKDLREMLVRDFGIIHATLEIESSACDIAGPFCDINNHTAKPVRHHSH